MIMAENWQEWYSLETKIVYGILRDEESEDPMTYYEDLIEFARGQIEIREESAEERTFDPEDMPTLAEYIREMVRELVLVRHGCWVSNKMTNTLLEMAMHKVEWSVLAEKVEEDARERIKLEEASP